MQFFLVQMVLLNHKRSEPIEPNEDNPNRPRNDYNSPTESVGGGTSATNQDD